MSEQPTVPSNPDVPPAELAAWEELAHASQEWPADHAGLQQLKQNHLDRLLTEKGLEHLVGNYLVTNEDEPADVHEDQASEQLKTEEQLSESMTESLGEALAKLTGDRTKTRGNGLLKNVHFLAMVQEAGVSTEDRANNAEFWDFYAQKAEQYIDKRYGEGDSMAELDSMQVLSRLPQFLLADQRISANSYPDTGLPTSDPEHPKTADKFIASRFNTELREYMAKYPEVSAKAFQGALTDMAVRMRGQAREADAQTINDTLWGAQVELAFGRILGNIGTVRTATDQEDLQGIDLVAEPDTPAEVCFDVKASDYKLDEIRRARKLPTPNDPVQRMYVLLRGRSGHTKPDGTMVEPRKDRVVFCPTPNSTKGRFQSLFMKDRFHMSDEMVAQAAQGFALIVDRARQDLAHGQQTQRRSS
ncbi:MAG TPA: hypothetical protein VN031_03875 [Candidatus Microsaccharimonas sp.]|nr:hypothetical protein [Candidatus Microsaccharimonas sp.]